MNKASKLLFSVATASLIFLTSIGSILLIEYYLILGRNGDGVYEGIVA